MKNNTLVVLDITSPIEKESFDNIVFEENTLFLPITPYAYYVLEGHKYNLIRFSEYYSPEYIRDIMLELTKKLNNILESCGLEYLAYNMKLVKIINLFSYSLLIKKIVNKYQEKNYEVEYITDRRKYSEDMDVLNTSTTLLEALIVFDKLTYFEKKKVQINKGRWKYISLFLLYNKIRYRKLFQYDWLSIKPNFSVHKINYISNIVKNNKINEFFNANFEGNNLLLTIFEKYLYQNVRLNNIKSTNFFVFASSLTFFSMIYLRQKKEKIFCFQHGSYYYHHSTRWYESEILKVNEIKLSDVNFVFNDFTKKIFQDLGAKNVYSVGSVLFNRKIREKKKTFDYIYITQGHDYSGNSQYVDFPNSLHSFDGFELYERHKGIIELFGTKLHDKNILIRVHPCVVSSGVYVPFWELTKQYKNITIDVSSSIHTLIEKSKYIISDYFTTEFINRELHYKRDILLFKGAPTPLLDETLEEMKKMFILVDDIEELKEKIENIDDIVKNRERDDDIIEYYSSKKCDTQKTIRKILKKE
ncbi:MAG: hypothetical protein GQ474_07655 [Sulfurimonas sp.]|nr:hypothetical protein [Sulfurimonas sp.]